jgi:hypothetical protein
MGMGKGQGHARRLHCLWTRVGQEESRTIRRTKTGTRAGTVKGQRHGGGESNTDTLQ